MRRQTQVPKPTHYSLDLLIPIARPKFSLCPPPLGSPRFARGTVRGAPVRFPLLAGGTLWWGSSTAVFCELWLGDWYKVWRTSLQQSKMITFASR